MMDDLPPHPDDSLSMRAFAERERARVGRIRGSIPPADLARETRLANVLWYAYRDDASGETVRAFRWRLATGSIPHRAIRGFGAEARKAWADRLLGGNVHTTYYRIDWRVPAENAIGGVAYWHPLEDAQHITDAAEARALLTKAQRTHGVVHVRLVRVEEYVEA